ncbi:hypothetical protein GOEFS_037_00070 [Gordonia effusa NBRC 100432]|uniref:Uncharacterized protein n=1 Tax=Gordonia effusa NBRC 100432 TaxID=1077974 RepID=H0QY03_9ACTN|nr:hypothetical protein [Gordonia effusa]GAB17704.1 hypothetical protein GOEFS_037_00070 [Gordonia effusa NBRC 100432]
MRSEGPNRILLLSIALFVIGLVAIVALFVTPLVADGRTAPTLVYVLTMCAPAGFVISVIATVTASRPAKSTDKKRRSA